MDVNTGVVATEKVTLVLAAGTVTEAGTIATAGLVLIKDTDAPPEGAGMLRVTVAVELLPPVTLVGFMETEATEGVWICKENALDISELEFATVMDATPGTATSAALIDAFNLLAET